MYVTHEHYVNSASIYSPCSVVGSKIVHYTLERAAMERALSHLLIALVCLMTRPINQAIAVRGKSTVSVLHVCAWEYILRVFHRLSSMLERCLL